MSDIRWETKHFKELTTLELFEVLKLRQAVFVVEQKCAYPDIDELDLDAWHHLGWDGETFAGCARLLKPGTSYDQASIGRITLEPKYRDLGLGEPLVQTAIDKTKELFPNSGIQIGAQAALESFYQSFGFDTVSDVYIEDDIPHIKMRL